MSLIEGISRPDTGLPGRQSFVHVPYKGLVLAMTDLTQGRVQLPFGTLASVAPYVRAGMLRGVAVTSPTGTPIFPELPTVAEAGVPGFEVVAWDGRDRARLGADEMVDDALGVPGARRLRWLQTMFMAR